MVSKEELQNIKAVLFGNQKQANVINESVVAIVAQYLTEHGMALDTEDSVVDSIHGLLQECAEYGVNESNATFIQLVAGPKSYQVLKDKLPYVITVNQPSTESPKHNFRIVIVGEDDVEPEVESGLPNVGETHFEKPAAAPDEVIDPDDSLKVQAEKLKNAILPMAPSYYMGEVGNEYAVALLCSQAYFEYNSR